MLNFQGRSDKLTLIFPDEGKHAVRKVRSQRAGEGGSPAAEPDSIPFPDGRRKPTDKAATKSGCFNKQGGTANAFTGIRPGIDAGRMPFDLAKAPTNHGKRQEGKTNEDSLQRRTCGGMPRSGRTGGAAALPGCGLRGDPGCPFPQGSLPILPCWPPDIVQQAGFLKRLTS